MNCIIVDDDPLIRLDLENKIQQTEGLNLVASCHNAYQATFILTNKNIDLLFLDVYMPNMTGFDFLKTIDEPKLQVIIITANSDYAVTAFDYAVSDFLLKPITYERFLIAVTKARKNNEKTNAVAKAATNFIFIKVGTQHLKIDFENIFYIEALADYVMLYTTSGKHVIHSTMKAMESVLPDTEFLRVHNSYIIRLDRVTCLQDAVITVFDQPIPVSRNKLKCLKAQMRMKLGLNL